MTLTGRYLDAERQTRPGWGSGYAQQHIYRIASSLHRPYEQKQTTELMCAAAQINIDLVCWEESIYAATTADLLRLVQHHLQKEKRLMLVGHNPAIEGLLCYLVDTGEAATNSDHCMTTANIAVLELNKADKNSLEKASAKLIFIARPKKMQ